MGLTYAQAGVSVDEGDRFVRLIRNSVRSTFTRRVLADIGGFGALFDARFPKMKSPVLVSSIDGVGTKLLVAVRARRYNTVGQDLVNHCVNDILVCGARPLFFLDYFAAGSLKSDVAAEVISGFSLACRENGCALIGGETAEMPGVYREEEFDLAGAIVGVVDRKDILDGSRVRKGDILLGLRSSGLHTNGYSLARKVLLERYQIDNHIEELDTTLADALLAVHRSYLGVARRLIRRFRIRAMAHITGGGIMGNTSRVVPEGRSVSIDWLSWERPPLFRVIQSLGDIPEEDMRRTFNLGIGLVIIVSSKKADSILAFLRREGEDPVVMGEVR